MPAIIAGSKAKQHEKKGLGSLVQHLTDDLRNRGSSYSNPAFAGTMASLESASEDIRGNAIQGMQEHAVSLENLASEYGLKDLTTAQITAGAMIANVAGNPAMYMKGAMSQVAVSQEGVHMVGVDEGGAAGGYGFADVHPSLEAFDNSNLVDFVGLSILYNIQAARQDQFSEAFFRTVVTTPDNGGVDLAIRNQLVFNHYLHGVDGSPANFAQKRLLDAALDYEILSDHSTTLLPEVLEDDSNADNFVAAAAVAPRYIDLGNRTVRTAPLKIGKQVDLIGISQNNLIKKNGVADNTDSLDRMTGLKNIYLQIADGDVIRFSTASLPRSFFVKGPEGRARQQILHFTTRSLQLNKNTVLQDGSAPTNAILQQIVASDLVVNLKLTLTGDLDTEYGNVAVNGSPVDVVAVYNAAREKLALDSGVGKQIVDGLKQLAIIGWDPNARLSNANRAERGLQLNNQEYVERYPVLLGPPMSIPSPLMENRDAGEMNALIAATRLRNSNNAVTKLLNYAENLESFVTITEESIAEDMTPEIEGIARFLVRPWHRKLDLHLPDHINSIKSQDRIADVQAVLVNAIRDGVYDAYRESNIKTALDALTGYTGEKVKVLIGTDPVLSRYIVTPGDTRTLGDDLDFEKVSTMDLRVVGKIFYTFIREGDGIDPLNFGSHIWIPELISSVQVSRNNRQFREAMVQNRSRHVVHLPILGVINVTGLHEAVVDQTQFPVTTTP